MNKTKDEGGTLWHIDLGYQDCKQCGGMGNEATVFISAHSEGVAECSEVTGCYGGQYGECRSPGEVLRWLDTFKDWHDDPDEDRFLNAEIEEVKADFRAEWEALNG